MKYLPILQELFESDTFVFMVVGIVIAVIAGLRLKMQKKCIMAASISAATYAICEIASNIHTNFMLEIILLAIGTAAIGCCMGFIISLVVGLLKGGKYER